tara:strand:+ start:1737 stop:1949 length:213 start_codon:yes stop_codon:yes gene_type:complete
VILITRLFSILLYFLLEIEETIQVIYKLKPKRSNDVKTLVEARTKKAAIIYFAALMHLNIDDLLKIYTVR